MRILLLALTFTCVVTGTPAGAAVRVLEHVVVYEDPKFY